MKTLTRLQHIFNSPRRVFDWRTRSKASWREYATANGIPVESKGSLPADPATLPAREYSVMLSKWWMTQSCKDTCAGEEEAKRQRLLELNARKTAIVTSEVIKPEPEPRFKCANVFDDGARCKRARERQRRYCARCARVRTLRSKRQHWRMRPRKNAFVSASA
jgi:hypothetical protein